MPESVGTIVWWHLWLIENQRLWKKDVLHQDKHVGRANLLILFFGRFYKSCIWIHVILYLGKIKELKCKLYTCLVSSNFLRFFRTIGPSTYWFRHTCMMSYDVFTCKIMYGFETFHLKYCMVISSNFKIVKNNMSIALIDFGTKIWCPIIYSCAKSYMVLKHFTWNIIW